MYIGDSRDLVTEDITDIFTPKIVSNIDIPDYGRKVVSQGSYTLSEFPYDLDVAGNYVHIIGKNHLYVINTTKKSNPTLYTQYYISQSTTLSSVTIKDLKRLDGNNNEENADFMFLTDYDKKVIIYEMPYEYAIGKRKDFNLTVGGNGFAPQPKNVDVFQKDVNTTALYIAGDQAGIYTIELNTTDISQSIYRGNTDFIEGINGNAYDLTIIHAETIFDKKDFILVAGGYNGILTYEITGNKLFYPDNEWVPIENTEGALSIEAINDMTFISSLNSNDTIISDLFAINFYSFVLANGYSENDVAVSVSNEKGIATTLDTKHSVFFIDISMME